MDIAQENIRIQLLGGLSLTTTHGETAKFETRRAASLFAFLALHRTRRHVREELIEMLWPDEDLEATRIRFRQVLTTLRRTLETAYPSQTDLLLTDRTYVQLNPKSLITDVAEFDAAIATAAHKVSIEEQATLLAHGISLYSGQLLPGFYDDWVLSERRRLEEQCLKALDDLTQTLIKMGNRPKALEYARRSVQIDPLREESHVSLIEILAAQGKITEALRHYRDLEQLLWKELRTTPTTKTQSLIESLRTHAGTITAPIPPIMGEDMSLADTTPPIRVTRASRLPTNLTHFFGRQQEIAHLSGMIAKMRLLTLIGTGGSGKTRLSLEVCRKVQPHFPGGIWFVSLADVVDPALIFSAIADTVRPSGQSNGDLWGECKVHLNHGPTLLVLDSMEHLIEHGPHVIRTLLEHAPELTCLVTSRQQLDLGSEYVYAVQPLPIPQDTETDHDTSAVPSVQLFLDRAQQVNPLFRMTPSNQGCLIALCRRLEGIPLALELAAAWAGTLTPAQMLARLDHRFDLLVSRRKDLDPRHRSLRATLDWSYEHLEPELQRCFAQLCVFRGGWLLDAAEAVCDEPQAFDILAQLAQRSMLVTQTIGDEIRFLMLETLRDYAREQLSADQFTATNQRHAAWYFAMAHRASSQLTGPDQIIWLDTLEAEAENLRATLEWYRTNLDTTSGLALSGSLWRFWDVRGHHEEGFAWVTEFLERADTTPSAERVSALEAAGSLALARKDYRRACEFLQQCVTDAKSLGLTQQTASALCTLGEALCECQEWDGAQSSFEESKQLCRERGDTYGLARTIAGAAHLALKEGDFATAESQFDHSAALHRIAGNFKGMATCIHMLGIAAKQSGNLSTAQKRLNESLALYRQINDKLGIERVQRDLDFGATSP